MINDITGEEFIVPVAGAFGGRQITRIELTCKDIQNLYQAPPEIVHEWLNRVLMRFGPESYEM